MGPGDIPERQTGRFVCGRFVPVVFPGLSGFRLMATMPMIRTGRQDRGSAVGRCRKIAGTTAEEVQDMAPDGEKAELQEQKPSEQFGKPETRSHGSVERFRGERIELGKAVSAAFFSISMMLEMLGKVNGNLSILPKKTRKKSGEVRDHRSRLFVTLSCLLGKRPTGTDCRKPAKAGTAGPVSGRPSRLATYISLR